jgi:amidase
MNLADLDATAQADLVKRGDASPRELVDAAIARIEKHDPALNAVIVRLFEQARETADSAPHGPFRGVPILIKDICATIGGVLYTAGLDPLRRANFKSDVDSHLVTLLKRAGFVIVGKTNTSELGILPSAEPPAWPPHATRTTRRAPPAARVAARRARSRRAWFRSRTRTMAVARSAFQRAAAGCSG